MLKRLDLTAFKKIYDKSAIAFAVINLIRNDEGVAYDFLYEYANQAMADIDGIKVSDLIGKKYSAIYKNIPLNQRLKIFLMLQKMVMLVAHRSTGMKQVLVFLCNMLLLQKILFL